MLEKVVQKSGKWSKKGAEKGGKSEKNLEKRAPKIDAKKRKGKEYQRRDFGRARIPKDDAIRRGEAKPFAETPLQGFAKDGKERWVCEKWRAPRRPSPARPVALRPGADLKLPPATCPPRA